MSSQQNNDEFVRRFVGCQQDLYAYILTLVPNIADAQDVLQETAVALWAKADEYRLAEPFMPWAIRFAWLQVRKFRMYQARRGRHVVALSNEALAALAVDRAKFGGLSTELGQLLLECVEKLSDADRLLLRQRYDLKTSIRDIAAKCGVQPAQLYKRLGHIRKMLLDCMEQNSDETK